MTERAPERDIRVSPSYLIDFVSLKRGEKFLQPRPIDIMRDGQNIRGLWLTKTRSKDNTPLSMYVDQTHLDSAVDWMLKQPQAGELSEKNLKKLWIASQNLNRMQVAIKKSPPEELTE